jgi:hypothetical protein
MGTDFNFVGKNMRYVKTKIDDTPKILHLLTCNLCPFLMFDHNYKIARCARYHSISSDTIDSNIYSYSVHGENIVPIKEVNIPNWCGLCKDAKEINIDTSMYVKNGHNKFETIPNIINNLVIISGFYVSYDLKLTKLISGSNKNTITFPQPRSPIALPESTNTTVTPTFRTCSCCGELMEGVSRKKNYGMCPKCWEENKNNKKVKEFAFINNFRLKRSAAWSKDTYKKIK